MALRRMKARMQVRTRLTSSPWAGRDRLPSSVKWVGIYRAHAGYLLNGIMPAGGRGGERKDGRKARDLGAGGGGEECYTGAEFCHLGKEWGVPSARMETSTAAAAAGLTSMRGSGQGG